MGQMDPRLKEVTRLLRVSDPTPRRNHSLTNS